MSEKTQILEEYDAVIIDKKGLTPNYVLGIILISLLILLLAFPKIFLRSSIYYKSRDISALENEYKSLKEENRIVKNAVERKKFKNQILDTIF